MTQSRISIAAMKCAATTAFALLAALASHAATVKTLDGKSFEGEIRFSTNNSLVVTSAEHEPITVELTNLARATFASGPFLSSGSTLPNGWTAQDIGETRGFARLDTNTFSLRVEGQSTNALACHFVSRAMHSDGQLTARVEQVDGRDAQGGIMIRGQGSSAFAALSLGSDGKLWFQRRAESDRREIKLTAGPKVTAPVWLRLQKSDKVVIASWSTDGRAWQIFATDAVKLAAERTWREGEGELMLLRASCGVFASSRGKDTIATVRVVPIIMTLHGLVGEYFAGQDFRQLRFARLDPQIRFNWGAGSPGPGLDKDDFSVRWTGKLLPPKTGAYTFYFDADDRARLWINGEEMPQASLKKLDKQHPPLPVPFIRGQMATVKMEFEEGENAASVKLGWAFPGQAPDVIPMTNFLSVFTATNSPESIALSRATNNTPAMRGVLLRDGSFVAGTVTKADDSAVRLSFPGHKDVPVPSSRIARIFLKPPQQSLPFEIAAGRSGVFMRSGDFFESDFQSIERGQLTTSSVLFGLKKFWLENGELLVVVLNDCSPASSGFEVRLLDGSVFCTARVRATTETITLDEAVLGNISIPISDLFEIARVAAPAASAANR